MTGAVNAQAIPICRRRLPSFPRRGPRRPLALGGLLQDLVARVADGDAQRIERGDAGRYSTVARRWPGSPRRRPPSTWFRARSTWRTQAAQVIPPMGRSPGVAAS